MFYRLIGYGGVMKRSFKYSSLLIAIILANLAFKQHQKLEKLEGIKVQNTNQLQTSTIDDLKNNEEVIKISMDDSLKNSLQNRIDMLTNVLDDEDPITTMRHTKNGIIVGYDYNITKLGIDEEVASKIVEKVIEKDRNKLEEYSWFNNLDGVRQEAVQNLAYNLGVGGLLKFDYLISYLKNGQYDQAAYSLLYTGSGRKSLYHRQVKGRAREIATQISTGVAKESFLDTIKKHEGFRKYPYRDTRGIWTVGYGINLEGRGFKKDEALMLLASASLDNRDLLEKYL